MFNLINVDFDVPTKEKYCKINICNYENNTISIVNKEGVYEDYLIVGSIGAFIENLSSENISSNLSGESIKINLSNNEIGFIKPSLIERFYISISNPIFTYLFFVLGFALIGLELFALGPGLMAFIGGSLVIFSTMAFEVVWNKLFWNRIIYNLIFDLYKDIIKRILFTFGNKCFFMLYLSSFSYV